MTDLRLLGRVVLGGLVVLVSCADQGGGSAGGAPGAAGAAAGAGSNGAGIAGSAGSATTGGAGGLAAAGGTGGAAGGSGEAGSLATGTAGARGGGVGGSSVGGSSVGGSSLGGAASETPPGYVPALVGVGYGGIRIVSRDGGATWANRAYTEKNGGDDQDLLRAVTYGKGLWLATGWKLVTSTDGVHWVDNGLISAGPIKDCNIVEGLAYDAGSFFAACTPWNSPGTVYRSSDGLTWTKLSTIGDTGGHLFLTYRGGKFIA
ncbi:MAG: hypothetical protein ABUS79_07105, partial [Pseudomonadota bacterium]